MKVIVDCRAIRPDHHNGWSRFTACLANALYPLLPFTALIHDTRLLPLLPKDIPYIMGPTPTISHQKKVTGLLNRARADVVFSPTLFFTVGKRRFALITSMHDTIGFDSPNAAGHEASALERLTWRMLHASKLPIRSILNGSDAIITVSQNAKQSIMRHKLTTRPVHVVYNAPPQLPAVTYQPQAKNLVYVGSFFTYKNVACLVRAINELPDYHLVLLSKATPKTRAALTALAKNPQQLIFKHGVSDTEYAQELSNATALVSASRYEGFGLPLIEAHAAGVPVICSDIPVFHEVCGGESALFFDPNNPGELVKRVRELPAKHAQLIAAGKQNAARFTWEQSASVLRDVLLHYAPKK